MDPRLKPLVLSDRFRPAVTNWNRLEGRPRREAFDRSLRAEIRDALWMACRQWQLGEFNGEDAGSAIKAKTQVDVARLNRYAVHDQAAGGYDERLPLETRVEREPLHFDLLTRAQIGRHWFKLLAAAGDFRALYLARFGFAAPPAQSEEETHLRSDRHASQIWSALAGRVVDGKRLLDAMRSQTNEHNTWLASAVPDTTTRQRILAAAAAFRTWFARVYSEPDEPDDRAWSDAYLEYQFTCAAPADAAGAQQTVLRAEQYHHGTLDWYAFDLEGDPNARLQDRPGATIAAAGSVAEAPLSFIPNPVEFGGMPNARWWAFEDRRIDFGNIRPSTTDLATLILAEFGLIYGNDWSVVPYPLDVGALAQVRGVVITDVFGVRTLIRPATAVPGGERMRWDMYHLTTTGGDRIDTRIFLAPVAAKLQESAPLERVLLIRDEMANMVWGIEDVIPGLSGGGTRGHEAAADVRRYLLSLAPGASSAGSPTGAAIRYRLGTTVAEHWIPFIPVHQPGSTREIRLQRAAMPRLIAGAAEVPVEPRGAVLRPGLDEQPRQPYFLHEEEVPRAGALVTRTYQRLRWRNGQVLTWLGRRKRPGRGQGSSGLVFDRIVPIDGA